MRAGAAFAVVLVAVFVLFLALALNARSNLASEREAINNAWQRVDAALEERADLVPGIVQTVSDIAPRDRRILNELASVRTTLANVRTPEEKIQANSQLDRLLSILLLTLEKYPSIRSNRKFVRLQDELAETENRIAVARRKYNDVLQKYNIDLELFPNNVSAALFGFHRDDAYFRTAPGAQPAPKPLSD